LLLTQACDDVSSEVFVKSQALTADTLSFFAEYQEPLLSWDAQMYGLASLPFCYITLRSDRDGRVWSGDGNAEGAWDFRGELTPGDHRLTFEARSTLGMSISMNYNVTVRGNEAPDCRIELPVAGQTFVSGEPIDFVASTWDADGDPTSSLWSSSLDGGLIEGDAWTMSLKSSGEHQITLSTRDAFGERCTDTVSIQID
jgi:hypothetical protein